MLLAKLGMFLLDLVFPITCVVCKKNGTHCCQECLKKITKFQRFQNFHYPSSYLNAIFSLGDMTQHGPLSKLIYRLKYDGCREIAYMLAARSNLDSINQNATILIPVPLHSRRKRWREYNQSELLAHAIAQRCNADVQNALERIRFTPSQVGKDKTLRAKNVKGAFKAQCKLNPQTEYILIDDVFTTGATLQECARTLFAAGARHVSAMVIAHVTLAHEHG